MSARQKRTKKYLLDGKEITTKDPEYLERLPEVQVIEEFDWWKNIPVVKPEEEEIEEDTTEEEGEGEIE